MSTTKQTIVNSNPCLTMEVALTLISEKVRFWSDEQRGLSNEAIPPRCMDASRQGELRQSLIEIADHCKTAMRKYRQEREIS
jgi:hypothetical protein